jgi:hypothetical protein
MLEKARMKGKKAVNPGPVEQGGDAAGEEDDGLCCTCGQKVGQHNHVAAPTGAGGTAGGGGGGTKDAGQGPGGGAGKTK